MAIRQQALATAQVYMRRYYTQVEMRRTNPYIVLATAFYLACKTEECQQHIRVVIGEARNCWPGAVPSPLSTHHALTRMAREKTSTPTPA
jgi:cyclin C